MSYELCSFFELKLLQIYALFFYLLWHIELKFCTWLSFYEFGCPHQVWGSPLCIDFLWVMNFIIILKVQFYVLFLRMLWEEADILVKYYKNIAFLSFHDGRIMHRLRCSGIFVNAIDEVDSLLIYFFFFFLYCAGLQHNHFRTKLKKVKHELEGSLKYR